MPKKKTKTTKVEDQRDDSLDNASIISLASDSSGSPEASTNGVDDLVSLHANIEKINLASEALTEKRPDTRIKALNFLIKSFQMHYFHLDESWDYCSTFLDNLESVIKKGKMHDQVLAAECLCIFFLQFDPHCVAEYFSRFLPTLESILRDASAHSIFRMSCANALSVFQFRAGHCDFISPIDLMKSFESIFKGSCLKGDGKAPVLDSSVNDLHVAALRAWGLLFTCLHRDIDSTGKSLLPILLSLLKSACVEMRIMAAELAVLIYERIRVENDCRFKGPYYNDLVKILSDFSNESSKSRSKNDRKRQRQSFRELLDVLLHSDTPETTVNFGSEVLSLTSSVDHFYYNLLCCLLKGGVSRHLQENYLIRDIFDLGVPVVVSHTLLDKRTLRNERRTANALASKLRTQKLSSHRDRRNVVVD